MQAAQATAQQISDLAVQLSEAEQIVLLTELKKLVLLRKAMRLSQQTLPNNLTMADILEEVRKVRHARA